MIKFSIITVTFNLIKAGRRETFLQAVESVEAQSYSNIEHIVIDGASTDGTTDMLQEMLAAGRISQLLSEPDSGIYDAMNKGAALATGDYLLFLNSDDYYHNANGLRDIAKALSKKKVAYSYGPIQYISDNGTITHSKRPTPNRFLCGAPYNHQSILISRTVFDVLGGYNTKYRLAADVDLMLRLFNENYKYLRYQASLATFRAGGASADVEKAITDMAQVWVDLYSNFAPCSVDSMRNAIRRKAMHLDFLFSLILNPATPVPMRKAAVGHIPRSLRKRMFKAPL